MGVGVLREFVLALCFKSILLFVFCFLFQCTPVHSRLVCCCAVCLVCVSNLTEKEGNSIVSRVFFLPAEWLMFLT